MSMLVALLMYTKDIRHSFQAQTKVMKAQHAVNSNTH